MEQVVASVFTEKILDFLITPTGREIILQAQSLDARRPSDIERLRRSCTIEEARAALELVELRKRAGSKFSRAEAMYFDRIALEQSSGEVVAEYKADRLARGGLNGPIVDLCCGIGGDTLSLAKAAAVKALDRSAVRLRMADLNLQAYDRRERCELIRADLGTAEIDFGTLGEVFHLDPDRRSRGARTVRLAELEPGEGVISGLLAEIPNGVIKFSPATDYENLRWPGELEMVSLRGECKQLLLWSGRFAETRLRATALPEGDSISDQDAPGYEVGPIGRYLYDPDPGVARLRLLPQLAGTLNLRFLFAGQIVLSADHRVSSPLAPCYEVEEVLGFHQSKLSKLRNHLHGKGIGPVAVKPRGVKLDVDTLSNQLSGKAGPSRMLFLLRLGKKITGVIAKPVDACD